MTYISYVIVVAGRWILFSPQLPWVHLPGVDELPRRAEWKRFAEV